MIMIMKKTGLVIAAAAAAIVLSGCATGARNIPENTPICETPCAPPNTCKCMNACKQKKHKRHHRRHCRTAENEQAQQTQMDS
jgi:hypothetical protein